MLIRKVTLADVDGWVDLRAQLWPDATVQDLKNEAVAMLGDVAGGVVAFVAVNSDGSVRAFAEAALRRDYVNGCETSPVAFLEGIYVRPEDQKRGLGRQLFNTVLSWAREQKCTELASDALLQNEMSQAFHKAIGFQETERVVYFRKLI